MGYLHITGGTIRNRKIIGPPDLQTRPMQAFLRKTLFDLISCPLTNCKVWDIFAGSGAIGIEALSRGASRAVFVEKNPRMGTIIQRNLELCNFETNSRVLVADFFRFERWIAEADQPDIVFIDPPFPFDQVEILKKMYNLYQLLNGALIVIRFPKQKDPLSSCPFYQVTTQRVYGDSVLVFGYFLETVLDRDNAL